MKKHKNNLDFLKPDIFNSFIDLLEKKDTKKIFKKIKNFHPSEIASYIQILDVKHRKQLLNILSKDFESKILVELEPSFLQKFINEIELKIIYKAINELDSDDAALIINSLDDEKKKLVLSKISRKERTFIEDNLSYDENTAGRLMQLELVRIPVHFNVGDVIDYLRKKRTLPKVFYNLYIVDKNQKLVGTIELSAIISSSRNVIISNIMKRNELSVHSSLDQEDVADIFRKRNLTSIAVIDDDRKLLGTINVDDIVDVIDDEAKKHSKLAGVGEQDFMAP